jgi:hypothetical protein
MRYLMTSKASDSTPDENLFAEMGKFIEELTAAGVLLATGGLEPGGVRLTSAGDEITVTDGPFTEAKEVIGGYAVFEVKSKQEAVEWTRRFMQVHKEHWKGWEGETEIRQIFDPADFAPKTGQR